MLHLTEPAEIPRAFAEAWNDGDADALAALFAQDADFVNVVGLWWEDRPSIREAHDYGFRAIFTGSKMDVDRVKVRSLGERAAVVVCSWSLTGQAAQGQVSPGPRRGVFTFVAERDDNAGWCAVSAQNTDRVPGAETTINDDGELRPTTYQ